ncbi:hypothetical protein WBP07_07600 [Novosphingobium sp. BL-8A]|uniref:hypothetical protein n=1 Tax=Novosphingobium sp. BL-8A TaxID=3127639 RepID=UPI0037583379
MAEIRLGIGDLAQECGRVVRENGGLLAGLLVGISTAYTVADRVSAVLANPVSIAVSVFVQYIFVEVALGVTGERRRFGSLFGANLISGLCILFGAILLVVPGLFLAARWALAPAFVVANGERASSALSASWQATRGCWVPIAFGYLIVGILIIVPIISAVVMGSDDMAKVVWWQNALLNIAITGGTLAGWVLAVASYRAVGEAHHGLETVFA